MHWPNTSSIQAAANANNLDDFAAYLERRLDELFIERMEGNDEIFSRVMVDREFRAAASQLLALDIFGNLRQSASPGQRGDGVNRLGEGRAIVLKCAAAGRVAVGGVWRLRLPGQAAVSQDVFHTARNHVYSKCSLSHGADLAPCATEECA